MATREEWQRLIDLSWDLALVEDDLRAQTFKHSMGANEWEDGRIDFARELLWVRFGVDS